MQQQPALLLLRCLVRDPFEKPRAVDQPEAGFFELRQVRGGPLVAAVIKHEGGLWSAEIDGVPCGEPHHDPACADGVGDGQRSQPSQRTPWRGHRPRSDAQPVLRGTINGTPSSPP